MVASNTQEKITSLAGLYRDELTTSILPFWLQHSPDRQHGGYYTCLTRDGKVFDNDQFI